MIKQDTIDMGLMVAIAKNMAIKYGGSGGGIKDIVVNSTGNGFIFIMDDGTKFEVVLTEMMSKSVYDTESSSQIGVDNARHLDNRGADYFVDPINQRYENPNLVCRNVQQALDELTTLIFKNETQLRAVEGIKVVDYYGGTVAERTMEDIALNGSKLISDAQVTQLLDVINTTLEFNDALMTSTWEDTRKIMRGDYLNTEEQTSIILQKNTEQGVIISNKIASKTTQGVVSLGNNINVTSDGVISIGNYVLASQKGVASGIAPLDTNTKIPSQYLPTTTVNLDGVNGLSDVLNGTTPIADIALENKTYRLSEVMDLLDFENGIVYVRKTNPILTSKNGKNLTPYEDLNDALTAVISNRNKIQILDCNHYENTTLTLQTPLEKFDGGSSSIKSTMNINDNINVVLGDFEGTVNINSNCILNINGELKGTIVIAQGLKPFIFVKYVNADTYPVNITKDQVQDGSSIGKYRYGFITM